MNVSLRCRPTLQLPVLLLAGVVSGCGPSPDSAADLPPNPNADLNGATVEYVAHAAVVIEASDGTRVIIDPYNGSKWMGYEFPSALAVDAALVTHPHYDHDATWHLGPETLAFREPGVHDVGPIRVIGIEGEHAGASRFRDRGAEPHNIIWVVEAGGLRFAHTGDNRLPTAEEAIAIGRVDVLFTHPFFPADSVAAAWAPTGVRAIVPVHTRLPELAVDAFRLPTTNAWLANSRPVRSVGNRVRYTRPALSETVEYHVLRPSAAVTPWPTDLVRAWELSTGAADAELSPDSALSLKALAARLGPTAMTLQVNYAQALSDAGQSTRAEAVLEAALAAGPADIEQTLRAHALFGSLLLARGARDLAAPHFEHVLAGGRTYASDALAVATAAIRQ